MNASPPDRAAARSQPGGVAASQQFARFVLASGVAAAANFGSRMLFSLALPYPLAIALAFCVGLVVAFALNRSFVFPVSANSLRRQMTLFVLVNLFGLVQTLVVSLVLARWMLPWLGVTAYVEEIAHAVGIAVPTVSSYLGHKYFSFRKQ